MLPKSDYFVLNGHTLGYTNDSHPGWFHVLAGDKDGLDWKNGDIPLTFPLDMLTPATLADFDKFRVCPKGHII